MAIPMTRLALVTGTSSGIGAAVARDLIRREWRVVGVSRRPGTIESSRYTHISLDLSDVAGIGVKVDEEITGLLSDVKRVALVNSAADPGLLGTVGDIDPVDMLRVYAVNVAAPTWLMGLLVRRSVRGCAVRIVNVSSGAALDAFPGLGTYGGSKAALRMSGMVLASELDASDRPNMTIMSYDPGTVATAMQETVRASSVATLPIVHVFKQLEAEGLLVPPEGPAAEIADYLDGDHHARFMERTFGAEAPV